MHIYKLKIIYLQILFVNPNKEEAAAIILQQPPLAYAIYQMLS